MTDFPDTVPRTARTGTLQSAPPGAARALVRTVGRAVLPGLACAGLLACSQAPQPRPLPEDVRQAAREGAPDRSAGPEERPADAEEAPPPSPEEGAGEDEKERTTVVMIDRGDGEAKPSLWEAAQAARKGREKASPPVASVTNENLHEYQDAELTFAEPGADEEPPGGAEKGSEEESSAAEDTSDDRGPSAVEEPESSREREEHWRSRVLEIRLDLREAADEIEELEKETASLRRSFYAEDDPYVRDGRIKPAWDRTRDRLTQARRKLERLREELDDTLDDGRRAGALPGWLREGIELEPSFEEDESSPSEDDLSVHEPEEPETVSPDEPPDSRPDEPK